MDVNTRVTLYPNSKLYDPLDCVAVDYGVADNCLTIECTEVDRIIARAEAAELELSQERFMRQAAEAKVERLREALGMIDAARAKAVAEIETVHQYLDECYVNDRDEGRAVPLIDRVVLLVSRFARDEAEVARLREAWVRAIDADMADDAHELGEAIAHASALLDYPRDDDS